MASNSDLIQGAFQGFNRDAQRLYPSDPKASAFQKHLARVLQGEDPDTVANDYHAEKSGGAGLGGLAVPQAPEGTNMPQGGNLSGPPVNNDGVPLPPSLGYEQNYQSPMMGPGQPGQGVEAPSEPLLVPVDTSGFGAPPTQGLGAPPQAQPQAQARARNPYAGGPELETQSDFASLLDVARLQHAGKQQRTQQDMLELERLRQEGSLKRVQTQQEGAGTRQQAGLEFKGGDREDRQVYGGEQRALDRGSKEGIAGRALMESGRQADNRIQVAISRLEQEKSLGGSALVIFKKLGDARKEIGQALQQEQGAQRAIEDIVSKGMDASPGGRQEIATLRIAKMQATQAVAEARTRAEHLADIADAMPDVMEKKGNPAKSARENVRIGGGKAAKDALQGAGQAQAPAPATAQGAKVRVKRKADGKTGNMSAEQAKQAVASGKFELVK